MWSDGEVKVLGLMSGSSLDGIDLAICHFTPDRRYRISRAETIALDKEWVDQLRDFQQLPYYEGHKLDIGFGLYLGEKIAEWLAGERVDLIGVHGFTVAHRPDRVISKQLGHGQAIFHATGIPVVDSFRMEDILGGGSGAPLAPVVERDLLKETGIFVNLGGISNASIHGKHGEVWARDLTGCNQVSNMLAQEAGMAMDEDGKLSSSGTEDRQLLTLAEECCLKRGEALSISNEWVRNDLAPVFTEHEASVPDKLATLYAHQAARLRQFLEPNLSEARNLNCMITGGGAHNPVLMDIMRRELDQLGVVVVDAGEQMIDFKESLLIAWMAYLHATKSPLGAWVWTGSSRDDIAGTSYGL